MKSLVLSGVVLAAMLDVSASAADMPVKAPVLRTAVYDWTGFYAGVSLGGRWSESDWTTTAADFIQPAQLVPASANANYDAGMFRVGAYAGYNIQFQNRWVAGIEGDFAWGDEKRTRSGIPGTFFPGFGAPDTSSMRLTWDGSIRGRLGVLITPAMLLYATGGVAAQHIEVGANCDGVVGPWCLAGSKSETFSTTEWGWTVGGGLEAALAPNGLLRAEYRYADYGSFNHTYFGVTPIDAVVASFDVRTHTALVGLAYKFGR
jgi:outer membrane immunogenic protein